MAKSKSSNAKKNTELKPIVSTTMSPPLAPTDGTKAETTAPVLETNAAATKNTRATKQTETRNPARKPELVKTEPRANLVPISLEEEIRQLAYLLSERRGFESGHETEDWLNAENEVRQRYHQHSA